MTLEQMAEKLKKAGWSVTAPRVPPVPGKDLIELRGGRASVGEPYETFWIPGHAQTEPIVFKPGTLFLERVPFGRLVTERYWRIEEDDTYQLIVERVTAS